MGCIIYMTTPFLDDSVVLNSLLWWIISLPITIMFDALILFGEGGREEMAKFTKSVES